MDVNDLRTVLLVLGFVSFVGIVLWAYSKRRRNDFDEAARLPFSEDDTVGSGDSRQGTREKR